MIRPRASVLSPPPPRINYLCCFPFRPRILVSSDLAVQPWWAIVSICSAYSLQTTVGIMQCLCLPACLSVCLYVCIGKSPSECSLENKRSTRFFISITFSRRCAPTSFDSLSSPEKRDVFLASTVLCPSPKRSKRQFVDCNYMAVTTSHPVNYMCK